MAKYSGAQWRPIPINYTKSGQSSVRGLVVHIMAGTLAGTDSWFRNPAARASSHFGTGKGGALYQWVDTANRAWAQANGNSAWLSIENEGRGGDALTSAQMDRIAEVFAWVHKTYGVPLQVAKSPSGRGLGYHAMGGASWGGHTSCPGSRIVAQLPEIVRRAKALAGSGGSSGSGTYTVKSGDTLSAIGAALGIKWQTLAALNGIKSPYRITPGQKLKTKASTPKPTPVYAPFPGTAWFKKNPRSALVTAMGKRLVAEGCGKYASGPGPQWTESDRKSYAAWQRKRGFTGSAADGWPGKTTWDALRVPKS
ncbi:peptidoglycan-binding protein [Streptomyces anulatus]|uniref:peptidoglycan-binding protein n=1 Tax=Streptomyces TaxID=1883 RepID=UPI000AA2473A|nr:peptidoglycan-binding protein [Streptomyces sp. TSRI0395]